MEQKTDPCLLDPGLNDTSEGIMNTEIQKSEMVSDDLFVFSMKRFGGLISEEKNLYVDSISNQAVLNDDMTVIKEQISQDTLNNLKRIVNGSSILESVNVYPPAPGSADYTEYIATATLNGKSNSVYWTDTSKDTPVELINLPYILDYIFGGSQTKFK